MDISFHYFAVKSVARAAGFNEENAQRIAMYSQIIDDFDWHTYLYAENIPDYVKCDGADILYDKKLNIINPVATGFPSLIDMAMLVLPHSQKIIVSPFHFIPQNEQCISNGDNRTVPAKLNDGSYISSMLCELKNDIVNNCILDSDAYMKMGMLFHTFADTYAHQLFTGYDDITNSVKLISVKDNISGTDVTKEYVYWIDQWIIDIEKTIKVKIPTIGHMSIAHIPDLSHLSFEMEYVDTNGKKHIYSRSNTDTFVDACKELYMFMRDIIGEETQADIEWDDLAVLLASGLLIDISKDMEKGKSAVVQKLLLHWKNVFKNYGYTYYYNSKNIMNSFTIEKSNNMTTEKFEIDGENIMPFSAKYSDDFYKFSLFADEHLIYLYGNHPRKLFTADNEILYEDSAEE